MKLWLRLVVLGFSLSSAVRFYAAPAHDHSATNGAAAHGEHHQHDQHEMEMPGMLGNHSMTREASGTSWQPDATPMPGLHFMRGDWMFMFHGFATLAYSHQGGRRGDEDFFSANMVMLMGQRSLGPGRIGFRTMLSLEPATIRQQGYPLLLQTGETADGLTPLIDSQHPHDLFMELALTYVHPITEKSSVFAYFGLPGEPALGPPAFMHRFTGVDNPEAPLSHHWLDSTHITFGVATLGYVWDRFKLDASVFTGREPDQDRWDLERPRFDSYAARLSFNPTEAWSLQASYGRLNSPEQLHPDQDTDRITLSAAYHRQIGECHWQMLAAWGRNNHRPGPDLDAFLLESALRIQRVHTLFGRAEHVEKNELFEAPDPREHDVFKATKLSLGYVYDFPLFHQAAVGIGGAGSVHLLSSRLEEAYGETPLSFLLFLRVKM